MCILQTGLDFTGKGHNTRTVMVTNLIQGIKVDKNKSYYFENSSYT